MIHLGDGKPRAHPALTTVTRNADTPIVAHDHTVGNLGVDPHVVVVSACSSPLNRQASVEGNRVRGREEVDLVVIIGRHCGTRVVERPLRQRVVAVHHPPRVAAVVRSPQHSLVIIQLAVLTIGVGLDERVNPVRIVRRHRQADLAEWWFRQSVSGEVRPRAAAVAGPVESAALSPTLPTPCPNPHLPHAGKQDLRIVGIHHNVRSPRVFVHEQDVLPCLTPVRGAKHAALLLRTVEVPHRGGEDDVGIVGVDDDPSDAARAFQAQVRPCLAAVCGLVDAVADGDVAADERLSRTHPHDVGIHGVDRNGPYGSGRLVVKDRLPTDTAIH